VHPRAFPRDLGKLLSYARNHRTDMAYHPTALPGLVPFLAQYWWHSAPARYAAMARAYAPLIAQSISEHEDLIVASGASDLIVKQGWYQLYRTPEARDRSFAEADFLAEQFGIGREKLDARQMRALEPALMLDPSGVLHWTDPWSIRDPNALIKAYVRYFEQLGGVFRQGDAMTLKANPGAGWQVETADGQIEAGTAVVAMGPWSAPLTRALGYRLPLAVKRGYHMHYGQPDGTPLRHWILDVEPGSLLAPMARGIRLTTGVEFARIDAPKTPIQLGRAEAVAKTLVPIGPRLDAEPWMGARPATPDMLPIIGPAPHHKALWFTFGHAHHGMTLGPATGRLIAELIGGETPYIDPTAFRAERFR
jgi:D-amino-acid dehydrogenase